MAKKRQDDNSMGLRLKLLRESASLSQDKLAAVAGVPVSSLRNWEQGHRVPKVDALLKLSKALGISLDDLLSSPAPEDA